MTEHITGQQARELLDAATPGPWTATEDHIMRLGWEKRKRERSQWMADESDHVLMNPEPEWKPLTKNRTDMLLAAAAPELAATVEWLYGRPVDDLRKVAHLTPAGAVAASPDAVVSDMGTFTPDEAVDLARALLAAAEKARRHTD